MLLRRLSIWVLAALAHQAAAASAVPGDARGADLVRADSLDAEIETLIQHERHIDAIDAALAQLDIRRATLGPDHIETLGSIRWLALAFRRGHATALAEELNDYLLERLSDTPHHPLYVEALTRRAHTMRLRGEGSDARARFDRALELVSVEDRPDIVASIRQGQAWARRQLEPEAALVLMEEAFAYASRVANGPSYERMNMATWYGWLLFQAGRSEDARPYLALAIGDAVALGLEHHFLLGVTRGLLSGYALANSEWSAAERLLAEAAEHAEVSRRNRLPGFGRGATPLHQYNTMAVCEIKQGRFEDAWSTLQKSKASVTTELIHLSRLPRENPGFAARADTLYALTQQYRARVRHSGHHPGDLELISRTYRARARVLREQLEYLDRIDPPAVTIEDVQACLDSTTAYIGWATTNSGILQRRALDDGHVFVSMWAYVIRQHGPIRWIPLAETFDRDEGLAILELQGLVKGRLITAARWPSRTPKDPELVEACRALGAHDFDPLLSHLEGIDRLVVEFGAGPLFRLPVEVRMLADGSFVNDHFSTAYTPSAAAFVATATAGAGRKPLKQRALLIGAPLDETDTPPSTPDMVAGGISRVAPGAPISMPPLHYARAEIQAISRMFRSTVLTGPDATEFRLMDVVRDGIASYDVVHIATHAFGENYYEGGSITLTRPEVPESAYDDGEITADEVLCSWQLDADLVTLSACQSLASIRAWMGELQGLGAAMLGAGARSVIGSAWDVDDEAAALLMVRFYENYTGSYEDERMGDTGTPMEKADALGEARQWLRTYTDDEGRTPFAHPVYWSGFVLIGSAE